MHRGCGKRAATTVKKNAGTITGKLRTKANHREADAELSALAHGPDQPRRSMR
jgi:hypothetical protein